MLEHFHMLEHRALLETTTGEDLSLLCWIKSCSERIQWVLSEEKVQLMAACPSTARSTCGFFPKKLPRWKWNGLKKEQNCPWGSRRRQKRMLRRARKSQGAGRLSEGKDMAGRVPKILSVGGDFLCKFR